MLEVTKKQRFIETFHNMFLRNIVKVNVFKTFGNRFKELIFKGVHLRVRDTLYIGTQSEVRRKFHS